MDILGKGSDYIIKDEQVLRSDLRALLLDMDGVLWRDNQPIYDLAGLFDEICKYGLKVALLTNNATLTVDQYLEKLRSFGVELEPWQIITSAEATGDFLQRRFSSGGRVYVIGEKGLREALENRQFTLADDEVCAVVVGLDRQLTYEKLKRATLLIREGALFIGTNPDRSFPTPQGLVPGAGAILAAIQAASDQSPIVIGKPSKEIFETALLRLGVTPSQTLMIGDRLDTDIQGARTIGCKEMLVLTGVTTLEEALAWNPPPSNVVGDLRMFLRMVFGS